MPILHVFPANSRGIMFWSELMCIFSLSLGKYCIHQGEDWKVFKRVKRAFQSLRDAWTSLLLKWPLFNCLSQFVFEWLEKKRSRTPNFVSFVKEHVLTIIWRSTSTRKVESWMVHAELHWIAQGWSQKRSCQKIMRVTMIDMARILQYSSITITCHRYIIVFEVLIIYIMLLWEHASREYESPASIPILLVRVLNNLYMYGDFSCTWACTHTSCFCKSYSLTKAWVFNVVLILTVYWTSDETCMR